MKTKQTLSAVLLGLALLAAGDLALANNAFLQLNNGVPNFDGAGLHKEAVHLPSALNSAGSATGKPEVPPQQNAPDKFPDAKTTVDHSSHIAPPALTAGGGGGAPAPAPNPITGLLGAFRPYIASAGLGAALGFMIAGTLAAALTGGLLFLGLFVLANL